VLVPSGNVGVGLGVRGGCGMRKSSSASTIMIQQAVASRLTLDDGEDTDIGLRGLESLKRSRREDQSTHPLQQLSQQSETFKERDNQR